MKKISLLFLIICFVFIGNITINAACSDKEINEIIGKNNLKYYEDEDIMDNNNIIVHKQEYFYYLMFDKSYSKLKDKLIIKVKDSNNKIEYEAKYDDYLKNYIIGSYVHFNDKTYEIKVYAGSKTACPNVLINSFKFTQTAYNDYQQTVFCDENKDVEMCKSNYDSSKISTYEFNKKAEEIEKKKNETVFDKILNIISEYWYFVVIPIVIILIYFYIKIKLVKKEVNKE